MNTDIEVLRVETVTGEGPYTSGAAWKIPDCYCPARCPAPTEGGFDAIHGSQRFGFLTREQLNAWFTSNARRELADLGFHIAYYRVNAGEVKHGEKQIAFKRDHAVLIRTTPLFSNQLDITKK